MRMIDNMRIRRIKEVEEIGWCRLKELSRSCYSACCIIDMLQHAHFHSPKLLATI